MAEPEEPTRRLVLVGAGHAHLFVLEQLALGRFPRTHVTLLSPYAGHLYSGMLGGLITGRYGREDAYLDLPPLAAKAGVRFILGSAVHVDIANRRISVDGGRQVPYDIASFAVGSEVRPTQVSPGDTVLAVKPIDRAGMIAEALKKLPQADPTVVVVGGGAGGVEIGLNIKARLRALGRTGAHVVLVDRQGRLMANRSEACAREAARVLAQNQVHVVLGMQVEEVGTRAVRLSAGTDLSYDILVWATGASAPEIFRASGLETDHAGFLLVDSTLRSVADSAIFAAGDAASLRPFPATPKSGVYAVRQGPILARNLGLALTGANERFQHYRPQPRSLVLINTGDGRAILSYGSLAFTGRWVMRLKDRIDRGFMRRFQRLAAS
jgi:pyridine nucleotide-disulfide oxidoreductase family protein